MISWALVLSRNRALIVEKIITQVKRKWIVTIHVAKNKTGLNEEAYRALLGSAGINSTTELETWEQYRVIMSGFKKLGFTPTSQHLQPQKTRNPAWLSEKQESYIRGLWKLVSIKKDEHSLNSFCKRICGAENIKWLSRKDASNVIVALRKMADNKGINPDYKLNRGDTKNETK